MAWQLRPWFGDFIILKIVTPFIETSCHKCGACDEARFVNSGPHLKQICIACGAYIKFFDKAKVPDVKEVKLKIFYMTEGDLSFMSQLKKESEFIEGLTGLQQKLMYWKLYLHARKYCSL